MDFMPQQIFYREVERQCKFALMAYEDLKQALSDHQQPHPPAPTPSSENPAQVQASTAKLQQWMSAMDDYHRKQAVAQDRLWYAVQAFLVAAGNISKLLWPYYRNKNENLIPERGPELRAGLAVREDSPLADRTLRNHFEHFDVRLEKWAVSSSPRVFNDSNIVRGGMISSDEEDKAGSRLRNFDPSTFAVTFRGESYHLHPLAEAIEQLWHRATVLAQRRVSA